MKKYHSFDVSHFYNVLGTSLCFTLENLWKEHQYIYCIFGEKQNDLRKQHINQNYNQNTATLSRATKIYELASLST